jgi:Archaeal/vacuolar-type H+-ATPase subunit E
MESLKNMIEEINEKLKKEVEKEYEEWYQQIEKVINKIYKETLIKINEISEETKRKIEYSKNIIISSAEIEVKNLKLSLINDYIDKIIDSVLSQIRDEKNLQIYYKALKKYIDEALEMIGKNIVVYCNEEDYEIITEYLKEKIPEKTFNVVKSNPSKYGGVIITNKEGTIILNNTIEARLNRQKDYIRKELGKILMSE